MNSGQKKGINFDLDTNALKIYYTEGDWRNAYHDVRNFFKKSGFEHIQGSGYHTLMPMSEPDVMTIVYRMTKRFPWINYCVRFVRLQMFRKRLIFRMSLSGRQRGWTRL